MNIFDTSGELLSFEKIQDTINTLYLRINERFPESSLSEVCRKLQKTSLETGEIIGWIQKPNYYFRVSIFISLLLLAGFLVFTIGSFDITTTGVNVADFVQMIESGTNEVMLITAGIVFLIAYDTRRKRSRIISAVNRLRNLAHLVDVHQLTKDPIIFNDTTKTEHSPERKLTEFELSRYLDYCTEMLSLISKLAVIYVQSFNDPVANETVEDLEDLTNGISNKIWQKIIILGNIQLRNKLEPTGINPVLPD